MAVVREIWGPDTDPSHPYHFDDDDMWMAPGFINEFHPVTAKQEGIEEQTN